MYNYVTEEQSLKVYDACERLFKRMKDYISKSMIVDYKLLGINEPSFITRDNSNGIYDVYYMVIIEEDKTGLMDNPDYIRMIFLGCFRKLDPTYNADFIADDKSVLTCVMKIDEETIVNLEVAILYRTPKRSYNLKKLIYSKWVQNCFWIKNIGAIEIESKLLDLKQLGLYKDIKNSYILKKNKYKELGRKDLTSLQILFESVDEIWKQYCS